MENTELDLVKIAVKWWADRMDGTIPVTEPKQLTIIIDKMKEYSFGVDEINKMKDVAFKVTLDRKAIVESNRLFKSERERFEAELEKLIRRDIEDDTRRGAYLYLDEKGAGGIVALAAEKCDIENGPKSVFAFETYVEMFVDKKEISVRFHKAERFEPLFYAAQPQKQDNVVTQSVSAAKCNTIGK